MRVLDLGCGPGFIARELLAFMGDGRIVGVDIEPSLLAVAAREANDPRLSFVHASAYSLPFADGDFDFAHARLVLQHVRDPAAALASMYRVLTPGGTVCITDVDDRWMSLFPEDPIVRALLEEATRAQNAAGGDRHIGSKLGHLLERAGFETVVPEVTLLGNHNATRRALYDVVVRGRVEYLPAAARPAASAALGAAYSRLEASGCWIQCGVFTVVGRKPVT
jgi:SAM-dependent methyltransferase